MAEAKHTADDLKIMQSLPLEMKETMSLARIRSWVKEYGEDGCFISYSGGERQHRSAPPRKEILSAYSCCLCRYRA